MLIVNIEFCLLDWYSSSPSAIVLCKILYMCKMFPSNRQKLKRKCDLHEISSTLYSVVLLVKTENFFLLKTFSVY